MRGFSFGVSLSYGDPAHRRGSDATGRGPEAERRTIPVEDEGRGHDRLADPGLDGVDEPEADGEAVDSRLRGEGGLLGVAAAALSGVGGGGDGVLELGDERVAGDLGGGGGEVHRGAPS